MSDYIVTEKISNSILVDEKINIITERDDSANIITEIIIDPELVIGDPEEMEIMYAKRVDFITDSLLYRGEATAGSLEDASVWRIRRVTIAVDDDVEEVWASGDDNFDKIWDSRLGYTYI